ncbi:MAG: glycosyltransferase family 4 protein, partial [Polyangiaceae bacterium]
MKRRVLHVVVAGEVGGAERMLMDLVTHPDETRAEHAIALFSPCETVHRFFAQLPPGVPVFDPGRASEGAVGTLLRSFAPMDAAWLAGCVRRSRASIVHLHTFGSHVVGVRAARAARARILRTEHSTRVYDDASCWPFSRWSLARTCIAVAVSQHVRSRAIARARQLGEPMRVVHNGVDIEAFVPSRAPDDGRPFTFLCVGRLEPRKGIDLAIEAIASVGEARLDVVGEGQEGPRLAARVRELGLVNQVRFFGRVDDVRPFMASSHALVSSSREEGLGIANLEAMACGRPVVALPTGGIPEIVKDGDTGFLAVAQNAEALAARMRDVMKCRDLQEIGDRARKFVEKSGSSHVMRRAYGKIYEELWP